MKKDENEKKQNEAKSSNQEVHKDQEMEKVTEKKEKGKTSLGEITVKQQKEMQKEMTEVQVLKERLDESEKECKKLEDRLLRVAADFDNFKKRTAKEFANLIKFANQDLIAKLTDTLDNFERALDSAKNSSDFDSFHKGVELIYNHLKDILTKDGLKEIKTKGEKFDPNLHEAVSQIESDGYPEGVIVQEISKGYILKDRVIKAPKVIVSKGKEKEKEKKRKEKEKRDSEKKDKVE